MFRCVVAFLYLVAVMDWFSRFVLSWELSNTRETGFCLTALEAALCFGQPEIWNSDQGAQFTAAHFLQPLQQRGVRISMDGRGRALDNVFIERLWRSLKYENIYLHGYADGREAKAGIAEWVGFYNNARLHQSLGNQTPMAVWRAGVTGNLGDSTVDMPLRLDNSDALSTYPQSPQQQQAA